MNGHPHQLLRMFVGKRAQENRIGNTVHRSSRADPKRNRKNGSRRECTPTQQRSGRIPQVLVQTVEPNAYPSFPRLLRQERFIAERAACHQFRLFAIEAAFPQELRF